MMNFSNDPFDEELTRYRFKKALAALLQAISLFKQDWTIGGDQQPFLRKP